MPVFQRRDKLYFLYMRRLKPLFEQITKKKKDIKYRLKVTVFKASFSEDKKMALGFLNSSPTYLQPVV